MIKNRNNIVVKKYKLKDHHYYYYYYNYSKLLGKESKFNYKCTEDANVLLTPYSSLFACSTPRDSFNNKKFSII